MIVTKIAVINLSQAVSRVQAVRMVAACQMQARRDFSPAWNTRRPDIRLYRSEQEVPRGVPIIALIDSIEEAGALGWHAETPDGREYGRVQVRLVLDNGGDLLIGSTSVCAVLSHEILELMADPYCTRWEQGPRRPGGADLYAFEVCDPVQGDGYAVVDREGAPWVSNFVLPNWFDGDEGQVDFMGTCPGPFKLAPGGYMIIRNAAGSETSVFGKKRPDRWRTLMKKHPASRTARRSVK